MAEADLLAHEAVAFLDFLHHDSVENLVDNGNQEIQEDDNVEDGAEEEDWP